MNDLAKIIIVLIASFCGLSTGLSQSTGHTLKKSQPLEGLPSPVVTTVHRDAKGFMWLGMPNGLYRYDGYEFVKYKHRKDDTSSLSENSARKILCEDKYGNLWLLSGNWSLDRYNVLSDDITRLDVHIPDFNDQEELNILGATADRSGDVWFTHEEQGLLRYEERAGRFSMLYPDTTDKNKSTNRIINVLEDSDNIFYVFTLEDKLVLDRNSGVFTSLDIDSVSPQYVDAVVTCSVEDEEGIIWLATNKGLFRLDKQNKTVLFIDNPYYEGFRRMDAGIPFDMEAMSWMFYDPRYDSKAIYFIINREIFLFHTEERSFTRLYWHPDDQHLNITYDCFFDKYGKLWIATDNRGLVVYDVSENPFHQLHLKIYHKDFFQSLFYPLNDRGSA